MNYISLGNNLYLCLSFQGECNNAPRSNTHGISSGRYCMHPSFQVIKILLDI